MPTDTLVISPRAEMVTLNVRVTTADRAYLDELAVTHNSTVSDVVRAIIAERRSRDSTKPSKK